MIDDLYQIPSMRTHSEELPQGNHPLPTGSASRGRFQSSLPSRQSPNQSVRSSPLSVAPSSITPGRRRVKSPAPETTPTRLRQQISMTTGASPSILGSQRSRKPSSPLEVPAGAPSTVAPELVPDEKPRDAPAITVDPASVYAPMQIQQHAYWEQLPPRHTPQPDPYNPYAGMPLYPRGDGPLHRHQSHDPYYSRTASPFPQNAGLAPPRHPFIRLQSPSGPHMMPQQLDGGQQRSNTGFPELDMALDWATPRYLGNGSGNPESHLQTPFLSGPPSPPLPPKPLELTSSIKLPDRATPNPSTNTEDTLPSFYDRQSSLSTQSVHSQHLPAVSTPNEAPEPPAPNHLETPKSPEHVLQDEPHESPVVSPKPARAVGGRPTTKALGLIEEGFNKITEIIEGLAEITGKPPSDLYRRLEKSRKGASEGHLWNIYLHYFARHEEEEAARLNKPLERTQSFRSQCYAQYKADNANFHELLETYQELEMAGTEMTVGQRKREVEKYEKKLRDIVSFSTSSCLNSF